MEYSLNYTNTSSTTSTNDNNYRIVSIILLIVISLALFAFFWAFVFILFNEIKDCLNRRKRIVEINHYIYDITYSQVYKDISSEETCAICLDSKDEDKVSLECKHIFHRSCIDKWFTTCTLENHDLECPVCRNNL